jgi:hypothetical protein
MAARATVARITGGIDELFRSRFDTGARTLRHGNRGIAFDPAAERILNAAQRATHASPPSDRSVTAADVLGVLRTLRIANVREELELQCAIASALDGAGIAHQREVRLASRSRIDFVVAPRIGIEVKKGKPNAPAVRRQLERYASTGGLDTIILVVERSVFGVSSAHELTGANGTHVRGFYIGLSKLWGMAL